MKTNLFDKAIAYLSPERALKRAQARASFSRFSNVRASKKRKSHATNQNEVKNSDAQGDDKRRHRQEAERLLAQNPFIKFAFREIQGACSPIKYIPQTEDPELNKEIEAKVNAWMETADYTGRRHLLDILSLGPARQLIAGEHALALIREEGSRDFRIQSLSAERIGGNGFTPKDISRFGGESLTWMKELETLHNAGRYCEGREFDSDGKLVAYWIFKRGKAGGFGKSESGWVFDKKFDAANILLFEDPLHPDEVRGVSELAQSLDQVKDHEESMESMQAKVKALARKFITYKSEMGDLPDNPLDRGYDDDPEVKGGIKFIEHPEGPLIDALETDYEAKIWNEELPNGAFGPFMECLRACTAFALHFPTSTLGVKGSSLQGTDVRVDTEKAMAEIKRKRGIFIRAVFNPLIRAQLTLWHQQGQFEDRDLTQVLQGRWGFPKDITADEGRLTTSLIQKARQGWLNDSDVAEHMGVSEEHMRSGREAQVSWVIATAMKLAKEHDVEPEAVIRLIKDQSLGNVPELEASPPPVAPGPLPDEP